MKPTNSSTLYNQVIGRSKRMQINITANLNKNSIRIMDGMLIIGWINKSNQTSVDGKLKYCQSIYGGTNSGNYEECRAFIISEHKAHNKNSVNENKIKTRDLINVRY
jgi:hypothetical protein